MNDKSDIGEMIVFKKRDDKKLFVHQNNLRLRSNDEHIISFNFRDSKDKINEVVEFFESFDYAEPVKFDIGNTGDVNCYYKGISPVLDKNKYTFVSVTLQELKNLAPEDIEGHTCTNCGFH